MEKARNCEIDILKGLAILAVVLGHTRFCGTHFIYLFHMAVFFMASGYFFKSASSDSLKNVWIFVWKRIKGLWVPFVVWNTIYTLLHNLFIKICIYTDNSSVADYLDASLVSVSQPWSAKEMIVNLVKGLFFAGHTELGGAFWFLRILFYICIAYILVDFALKRFIKNERMLLIMQGVVSALFLTAGFIMGRKGIDILAIDRALSCYCLYYIGVLLGKLNLKERKIIIDLVMTICCGTFIYVLGRFGSISLGNNEYENPVFMLAASLLGWFMLLGISDLINHLKVVKRLFVFIGQNTIFIVIFHFLAFKPVNLLISVIKGNPVYTMAGFPVAYNNGAWWVLYTVFGVGIPLCISALWNRAKFYLNSKK